MGLLIFEKGFVILKNSSLVNIVYSEIAATFFGVTGGKNYNIGVNLLYDI